MKKLKLETTDYQRIEYAFGEWLGALGYAGTTVYGLPTCVREFLHHLENLGIKNLEKVSSEIVQNYFAYLQHRNRERRGGQLSASYINKHRQALVKLSDYVFQTQRILLPVKVKVLVKEEQKINVLGMEEVLRLYASSEGEGLLKYRDIAMLEIYYACGLRRNEGVDLRVEDIHLEKQLLFVRKGKNYRQRYVPFTKRTAGRLNNYLLFCRSVLLDDSHPTKSFFLSVNGVGLQGQSLAIRLKKLVKKAGLKSSVGLHTLRHSIATHLLSQGMKLENIQQFLGHSSIESTQIYTHFIKEESEVL